MSISGSLSTSTMTMTKRINFVLPLINLLMPSLNFKLYRKLETIYVYLLLMSFLCSHITLVFCIHLSSYSQFSIFSLVSPSLITILKKINHKYIRNKYIKIILCECINIYFIRYLYMYMRF